MKKYIKYILLLFYVIFLFYIDKKITIKYSVLSISCLTRIFFIFLIISQGLFRKSKKLDYFLFFLYILYGIILILILLNANIFQIFQIVCDFKHFNWSNPKKIGLTSFY